MGALSLCVAAVLLLAASLNVDSQSAGGRNVCRHRRQQTYTESERYTVKCKLWGWRRCARYRQVHRSRWVDYYTCCSGWSRSNSRHCDKDMDECLTSNGDCEQNCTNTVGSFLCECSPGYLLADDGTSCGDIDECLTNNGDCEQKCENTVGSFLCECSPGYLLADDGKSCDDIDECLTSNGGCEQKCENTVGSFLCECSPGYLLADDGKSCDDVNECEDENGGCSQSCTNTDGSFFCSCEHDFVLEDDRKTCVADDAPQNLKISESSTIGSGSVLLFSWDLPINTDGLSGHGGYIVEISNLSHTPPSQVKVYSRGYGLVLRPRDGPTTVTVRAVTGDELLRPAEFVIPTIVETGSVE